MKKDFLFSPISLLYYPLNTALLCVCASVVTTTLAHSESSLIKGPESQIETPSPSSTDHSSQSMQIKRLAWNILYRARKLSTANSFSDSIQSDNFPNQLNRWHLRLAMLASSRHTKNSGKVKK